MEKRLLIIISKAELYLCHTKLLSIQQHSLCHTDRSRGYRQHCLYSVLNTVVYSLDRTSLQHILNIKKVQL